MKSSFDITTLIGSFGGIAAILLGYFLEGGTMAQLLAQVSPFVIIFGGTGMCVLLAFRGHTLAKIGSMAGAAFKEIHYNGPEAVEIFERLAEKARREGLLSLESESDSLEDPFLKKGIQLVVDGTEPENIRTVLEIDIEQRNHRHKEGIELFEAIGGILPTMGIVGTVLGLIVVLSQLDSGGDLGAGIAVAFLATLYGVGFANLFALPFALKLKQKNNAEVEYSYMILEGILSIQQGENPRTVAGKLEGFLTPAERARRSEEGGGAAAESAAA